MVLMIVVASPVPSWLLPTTLNLYLLPASITPPGITWWGIQTIKIKHALAVMVLVEPLTR